MFYKASVYISDILEQQNKFSKDEKEIYRYGIQQTLNLTLNILTTIIIGLILHTAFQSIWFLICYIPLRSYCGGYHAPNHLRCYIYSVILITCILEVTKHFRFNNVVCESFVLLSFFVIILLAPIEDKNKPLDNIEKKVFRKKACKLALIEVIVYHVLLTLNLTYSYVILSLSLLSLSLLMIIGAIKNNISKGM